MSCKVIVAYLRVAPANCTAHQEYVLDQSLLAIQSWNSALNREALTLLQKPIIVEYGQTVYEQHATLQLILFKPFQS